MKYEQQILEAYTFLGFSPRGTQVANINEILTAFLDEGIKTVTLSAPTGTGKSLIGAVTAEVLHRIKHPDAEAGASFLLSPTNLLSEQYHTTFQKDRDPWDTRFRMIKGAGNYECSAMSNDEEQQSAEVCANIMFKKQGMEPIIQEHCNKCLFMFHKSMRDRARHLITNYSMFFVDRMYTKRMAARTLTVFDEAHLINDLFTEHNAIYFSDSRLVKMQKEISEGLTLGHTSIFKDLKGIREDMLAGKINEGSYMQYLEKLVEIYHDVAEQAASEAERAVRSPKRYLTLSNLNKKYFGLGCKISDLMTYNYPHAFEHKPRDPKIKGSEDEVSVKPIFVGDMFSLLENSEHNLLMSATFSATYAKRTLTLGDSHRHIRLEPTFPREHKKVVFFKTQTLNYNTMKNPDTLKKLQASTYEIVKHHTDLGDRGIVLAPSFVVAGGVAEAIRQMGVKTKVFEQVRGEKLGTIVNHFKEYDQGPALLITPSGFEGLDLAGDLSRYQIILKTPFASLGEARIRHIANQYPDIYKLMATMKVVQGAGRSVRGPDDYATTYILDHAAQALWTSNEMEWANEFSSRFSSLLIDPNE
jgi:Rad3-related DNA helicase